MILLIIGIIIGFFIGCIMCYLFKDDKQKVAEKPYGYKIHVGEHWWNINLLIEEKLPKLPEHLYRWELYTIENPGQVKIVLNILDMHTNDVMNIVTKDITYMYSARPWSALKGCSRSYIEDQIHTKCIYPVIASANRAASHLAGWEVKKTNYKVL